MLADQQEVMSRIHQVLVREFNSKFSPDLNAQITVSDIYYDLVPFHSLQDELAVGSMNEYEEALLRLLAGHGGFLELESLADRQRVQRHVETRSHDPGLFRDLLNAGVRICSAAEERPPAVEENAASPG